MCGVVVVLGGEESLRYKYNIRHRISQQFITFYDYEIFTVYNTWQV